jgi:hypothetical protein
VVEELAPQRSDDALTVRIGQSSQLHPMRVLSVPASG